MIPKIIHLCWFGPGPYPASVRLCLRSWKKFLPDYTVKVWTRKDAEALGIRYCDQALSVKKWAFAADVVRVYALYEYGGLYMDSDILVYRRFDEFLGHKTVLFHEPLGKEARHEVDVQAAFMASEPGCPMFADILDEYRRLDFFREDGTPEMDILAPEIYARVIEKYGYLYEDTEQDLSSGAHVYPARYVASTYPSITDDSFALHKCNHSWDDYTRQEKWNIFKYRVKKITLTILRGRFEELIFWVW